MLLKKKKKETLFIACEFGFAYKKLLNRFFICFYVVCFCIDAYKIAVLGIFICLFIVKKLLLWECRGEKCSKKINFTQFVPFFRIIEHIKMQKSLFYMLVDKVQIKMQCIELVICAFSILLSLKGRFELPCSRLTAHLSLV